MRHERKKSDRIKVANDRQKMQLSDSNAKIEEQQKLIKTLENLLRVQEQELKKCMKKINESQVQQLDMSFQDRSEENDDGGVVDLRNGSLIYGHQQSAKAKEAQASLAPASPRSNAGCVLAMNQIDQSGGGQPLIDEHAGMREENSLVALGDNQINLEFQDSGFYQNQSQSREGADLIDANVSQISQHDAS